MIVSFSDRATEDLYDGRPSKHARRFPNTIVRTALRKLDMLNAAYRLEDLREPPGNQLEALKGNLAGFHSIRINDQWRICFSWRDGDAHDVEIVDYH